MDKKLDLLSQIKTVETPSFLLTRIMQKVENQRNSQFSLRVSWAWGFSLFLIVSLNIAVLVETQSSNSKENIAQKMSLLPQNDFYK